MGYQGLISFIKKLEENNELHRISTFADPILEITEITDRVVKSGTGKALLFENSGTQFPVLINAFGSDNRMAMALGRNDTEEVGKELESLFDSLTSGHDGFFQKLTSIPRLIHLAGIMPSILRRKGSCQEVILKEPDLAILPVLKCWPYDGGRFITLPIVHTIHPETGRTNAGMYRMQVLNKNTTGMHWQRHKTGANHFEAWKKSGRRMPVSVALGGDPVYTYSATAPLPENINEYILAGFLRGRKVRMVKCITNELYVPSDCDIVIEGYVDPAEDLVWEGPFGDHTGFYSLADWYPKFHVTCITHSRNAVYPATIVGIPPQEDAWLAKATEKIFLSPVRLAVQPEITDFHMPEAGTAHNLVVVKINKSFPGQGMKVINSLFGAGQMMFSKYIVVVSGEIEIRNYSELARNVCENINPQRDILFSHGPLDVLDHASDCFSFGGKAGFDATVKLPEETAGAITVGDGVKYGYQNNDLVAKLSDEKIINSFNSLLSEEGIPVLIISADPSSDPDAVEKAKDFFRRNDPGILKLILAVDHTVDTSDLFMVAWQVLGNSDPYRDHEHIGGCLFIDGTVKAFRKTGFPRKWPNVVCSDEATGMAVDRKWESLGIGTFIGSPSVKYMALIRNGKDEIEMDGKGSPN